MSWLLSLWQRTLLWFRVACGRIFGRPRLVGEGYRLPAKGETTFQGCKASATSAGGIVLYSSSSRYPYWVIKCRRNGTYIGVYGGECELREDAEFFLNKKEAFQSRNGYCNASCCRVFKVTKKAKKK